MESQEKPNVNATAKKHGCKQSTLQRRWTGVTGSRADYEESRRFLNNQQVKTLIKEINRLSERGTPPTVAMVRTFAGNIAYKLPGRN